MATKSIGRNAPCPCGSGKQYKQCCRQKDRAAQSAADRAKAAQQRQAALDALAESEDLDEASNSVVYLIQAGKLDQAEQAALALRQRYPEVIDGHERLGMVHEARGDRQQATECYRKAVEMIREHPEHFSPEYEQDLRERISRLAS
jgi:tetratricopeptide (TPR) repeat protein